MILIDTGPLVALCDRGDSHHRRAVRDLGSLVATAPFATCDAVLSESCFHLPELAQRRRLQALLGQLAVASCPASTESRFRDRAFQWVTRYAEHEPDWADACLAVLSSDEVGGRVWTYDREFKTTWRRLDGSPIPLAVK